MKQPYAVVLAAGEGKRMHSVLPKVLHHLCGRPMIDYILESAAVLTDHVLVVVGHGASQVKAALGEKWRYVLQEEQLGTGHALMQALDDLPAAGKLMVLCGDTPLLEAGYLQNLLGYCDHRAAAVATVVLNNPAGYGRIVRNSDNFVERIVEERDATNNEKNITEINAGTYCFDLALLRHYLPRLSADNAQKEYYLTDVISLMHRDGHQVGAYQIDDHRVGLGINDRSQLAAAAAMLREKINDTLMISGVTIIDPGTAYIDYDVEIGPDTEIGPNCIIEAGTVIGSACKIGPGVHLRRAVIKDGVSLEQAIIEEAVVDSSSRIKPYSIIRSKV